MSVGTTCVFTQAQQGGLEEELWPLVQANLVQCMTNALDSLSSRYSPSPSLLTPPKEGAWQKVFLKCPKSDPLGGRVISTPPRCHPGQQHG